MRERPILFSAPMVRAILAGTKTQTRRVVKPQPTHPHFGGRLPFMLVPDDEGEDLYLHSSCLGAAIRCPYGAPGDRLWVREAWMDLQGTGVEARDRNGKLTRYAYAADTPPGSYGDECRKDFGLKWRPSIHMPRAASRITLEITGVRVERLQDISEADAVAEGVERVVVGDGWRHYTDPASELAGPIPHASALGSYRSLWESINGPGSWDANPWVWVVEFQRVG